MNVIIDYKVGNLNNLKNALDFSSVENRFVSVADDVHKAEPYAAARSRCFFSGNRTVEKVGDARGIVGKS